MESITAIEEPERETEDFFFEVSKGDTSTIIKNKLFPIKDFNLHPVISPFRAMIHPVLCRKTDKNPRRIISIFKVN